jgi:hypothetical protein
MKKKICLLTCLLFLSIGLFSQIDSTTCSCLIPIDSSFQIVPMTMGWDPGVPPYYQNNNAATPGISLPFQFCFYNLPIDSVYISNNGIITFNRPIYPFIIQGGFPLGADSLVIAPFFADANTLNNYSGYVWYKITPTYMIVVWDSVRYYGTDVDGWNYYQLIISNGSDPILPNGNNVSFCYKHLQWTCGDSSGFYTGYNGVPAIVGVNRGDGVNYAQISTFNQPGTQYYGPYQQYNGVQWLNYSSFIFNTCQQGVNIAPVIYDFVSLCDTFYTCNNSGIDVSTMFICPEQAQTVTFSASCPGISNVSIDDSSTVNIIDSVSILVSPSATDTGIHVLTITATDNFGLASSISYIIVVQNCTGLGIDNVFNDNGYSIFPNPNEGMFNLDFGKGLNAINCDAKVYDLLGREIYSSKLKGLNNVIDLTDKSKGIYFLKVFKDNQFLYVDKIVIL